MKNRARYKNIINKSKGISKKETVGDPFDLFVKTMPTELDYYKDSNNYRLKAAWEAYGKPKDVQEAWYEGLIDVDRNKLIMPSIGYNEETDSYEYLNTGKDNDVVNKDIRVWENDTIPFVKELKNGGYIRQFDEEQNCWMYKKGGKTQQKKEEKQPDEPIIRAPQTDPSKLVELVYNSDANFAKRLIDPNRKLLDLGNDTVGSHKLSWATTEYGPIVYPEIQEIDGQLVDLSSDWKRALRNALDTHDYIVFPSENDADWFTADNYKQYFPGLEKYAPQAFKQGGQMNVIPEGALHARKNNMELAKEGEITHKGIPVVDKEGGQVAEVEKEEITFTKPVTEKLEDWYKKFYSEDISDKEKDELAIKCGKFIAKEILFNTDDRVGLIEKIKEQEGL